MFIVTGLEKAIVKVVFVGKGKNPMDCAWVPNRYAIEFIIVRFKNVLKQFTVLYSNINLLIFRDGRDSEIDGGL